MKYLQVITLVIFSLIVVVESAAAQELSRKERKLLKKEQKKRLKELKSMNAEDFQKAQDLQNELKSKSADLENEVSSLKRDLYGKEDEVKQLKDQVRRLEDELQQVKSTANSSTKPAEQNVPMSNAYDAGLVFRVQIGAFRDKKLEQYLQTSENFSGEKDAQGLQIYTLGNFRDYWEADKFKKYLRAMGVRDAWIVPYQDGGRVPLKQVLENLQKQTHSTW